MSPETWDMLLTIDAQLEPQHHRISHYDRETRTVSVEHVPVVFTLTWPPKPSRRASPIVKRRYKAGRGR